MMNKKPDNGHDSRALTFMRAHDFLATCWAPSVYRFGKAFDHSLLKVSWKWRVKKVKMAVRKDFKAMSHEAWSKLGEEITKNLQEHAPIQHHPDNNDHLDEKL